MRRTSGEEGQRVFLRDHVCVCVCDHVCVCLEPATEVGECVVCV